MKGSHTSIIFVERAVVGHPVESATIFNCCVAGDSATVFASQSEAEDVIATNVGLDVEVVVC